MNNLITPLAWIGGIVVCLLIIGYFVFIIGVIIDGRNLAFRKKVRRIIDEELKNTEEKIRLLQATQSEIRQDVDRYRTHMCTIGNRVGMLEKDVAALKVEPV